MSKRPYLLLLALPFIATLVPPFYARSAPALFGFPFFYWYLVVWIVIAAAVVWVAYAAQRRQT